MSGKFYVDSVFTLRYSQANTEKAIFHVCEFGYFRGLVNEVYLAAFMPRCARHEAEPAPAG